MSAERSNILEKDDNTGDEDNNDNQQEEVAMEVESTSNQPQSSLKRARRSTTSEAGVATGSNSNSEEQQSPPVQDDDPRKKPRRTSRSTAATTATLAASPSAASGTTAATASAAEAVAASGKKKKKAGRKSTGNAAAAATPVVFSNSKKKNDAKFKQTLLQDALADARQEFESVRDEILNQVPDCIKEMFGSIGFAKWSGSKLPVLIMNPYHVPPTPVRAIWLEMFGKVKNMERLEKMSYLVYWYGEENEKDMYSLIAQSAFIPYDEAIATNPIVSKPLQIKVDNNKPLTKQDKAKIRAQEEVQEDLVKDPSERRRGVANFIEGYQTLKEEDVDEALQDIEDEGDAEEEDDGEEEDDDDDDEKPKKAASKKKPQKKKGRASIKKSARDAVEPDEVEEEVEDEPEAPKPTKKVPKKKATARVSKKNSDKVPDEEEDAVVEKADGKKKKKANSKQRKHAADNVEEKDEEIAFAGASVNDADIGDADESDDDAKPAAVDDDAVDADGKQADVAESKPQSKNASKGSKPNKNKKTTDQGAEEAAVEEEALGKDSKPTLEEEVEAVMKEASGESEEDDESFDDSGDFQDDEDDGEYGKPASKGQKKATREAAKSAAGGKAKKDAPAKKAVKAKHKIKEMLPAQKIKAGKKHFRENEKQFAPLIESWDSACSARDAGKIAKCLDTVSKELGSFCAKFIEVYSLSNLMKTSKNVLKDQKKELESFQDVRQALKTHYLKVQDQYPAFEVKKAPLRVNNDAEVEVTPEAVASKLKAVESRQRGSDTEEPPAGDKAEVQDSKNAIIIKKEDIPVKKEGTISSMAKLVKSPQKPAPKAEQRPKFTLKNLMRQSAKPPPASVAAPLRATSSSHVAVKEKPLPTWVSGPTSLKPPPDVARTHALAFLRQMAEHFPHGKIDCDSVAMSVEKAIFEWSTKKVTRGEYSNEKLNDKDEAVMSEYWQRVHAIVAGVCGKRDPGPLMHAILAGDFLNPKNLVELPEGTFFASFEGQELVFD